MGICMNIAEKGISVILPAYNEENNIEYIIQSVMNSIPKIAENYEVIVVDGGSKDQTSGYGANFGMGFFVYLRLVLRRFCFVTRRA